jgi:hypothetical protein
MKYYSASFIFAVGVGLLILGLSLIVIFQLHYGSEPYKVEITFSIVGISIPIIIHGINMMLGYKRYFKITTILGFVLSFVAVLAFVAIYPEGWFYPNVTYVAIVYALGLILLFSSSFAEAVVKVIETSVKTAKKIITTETAEKEVEETLVDTEPFVEPITFKEPEIIIKDISTEDIKLGKALEQPRVGRIVKVKDAVTREAEELVRVKEGELKVKKTDSDIFEAAKALKSIEERMGKNDKKKIFGG